MRTSAGMQSRGGMGTASGARMGTARMKTGLTSSMGRQAAQGIALQQGIHITDRPTTMQGMKGMRATTAGPGRLVQDSTFFVGVIRSKVNSITEEIARLQKEIDDHTRDQSQSISMQRKAEELDKEVRALEGTLADYNIAMDKQRQGSDPSDITRYIQEYEMKNRRFKDEIDRIFLQNKQEEQACQTVEQQIEQVYAGNQAKINAMDSGKMEQYQELVRGSMQLQENVQQQQLQVDNITDQAAMLQAQRDANTFNQDFRRLEQQAMKKHKEMQALMEELEISRLEPDEMQQRMLAKVRADNTAATAMDERIKLLQEEVRKSESALADITQDLADRNNGGNSDKDKYEKLYQRDREMTEFIDQFEGSKGELVREMEETQERVVGLLEHISNGIESEGSMPDQARVKEMNDEATFKERQLESSQATMARLLQEKDQKTAEMEKIKSLDEKIQIELGSLAQKMDSMQEEMGAFDDLEGLRGAASESKQYLHQQIDSYKKRMRDQKDMVSSMRREYEGVKKQLEDNDTFKSMENMEERMRRYAQTIFQLEEYIANKGRETDYVSLKESVMGMAQQLNKINMEDMMKAATNLSSAPLSNTQQFNGGGF